MANKNLEKWANSYSGCDGGDISSDVWLCGVEWGWNIKDATDEEREKYYKEELPEEIQNGEVKLDTDYDFFTDSIYPFNTAFKKVFKELSFPEKLLKLNMSPISFNGDKDTLWTQNLVNATGFETKNDFMSYIMSLNRFTKIRTENKPKLIVCVGVQRKDDFSKTFFGDENLNPTQETIRPADDNGNQDNRYIYHVKHDNTLLVVIPFSTSPKGIQSDYLLKEVGKTIAELVNKK